jgi:asparagine synthetase B (glutamine-hydrolysing)
VTYANEITEGLSAEIGIQLFSLLQVAGRKHKYVLTGYGADYLFGGMLKHKLYMQLTGCNDTQTLIDRAVWAKEFSPFYAWQIGVIPVHFYWNEEFIQEVLQVPLDFQFLSDFDKYLIRSAAVSEKWLTKEIAFRPKLALTNGTQMNKIFSQFLELPDEYSYDKKTRRSQEKLRSLIEL